MTTSPPYFIAAPSSLATQYRHRDQRPHHFCDKTQSCRVEPISLPPPLLRSFDLGALAAGRLLATEPVRLPRVRIGPHNIAANPLRRWPSLQKLELWFQASREHSGNHVR